MSIDVVIPTVDRAVLLRNALEGVFGQDVPSSRVTIVVVDNSSAGGQRAVVDALAPPGGMSLVYVHEPRPGLAYARNAGVAASSGDYVVFLDDDETPLGRDWLARLTGTAERSGADGVFGAVIPRFEMPPARFAAFAAKLYTRDLKRPPGADISDLAAHLGTGNSCFLRTCFDGPEPFRHDFDLTGGEDVDLLHRLRQRGCRFVWAAEAAVHEFVPASRVDQASLTERRFRQGQQRSYLQIASQPRKYLALAFWMAAGAAQAALHLGASFAARLFGRQEAAALHMIQFWGGAGKVLWQASHRGAHYRRLSQP